MCVARPLWGMAICHPQLDQRLAWPTPATGGYSLLAQRRTLSSVIAWGTHRHPPACRAARNGHPDFQTCVLPTDVSCQEWSSKLTLLTSPVSPLAALAATRGKQITDSMYFYLFIICWVSPATLTLTFLASDFVCVVSAPEQALTLTLTLTALWVSTNRCHRTIPCDEDQAELVDTRTAPLAAHRHW